MSQVYLRDFIPTLPIPPLFMIDEKDLENYFEKSFSVQHRRIDNEIYVKYVNLFDDSILSKLWFRTSILSQLSNHHLYCLEVFLNDTEKDSNLTEYAGVDDIYVQGLDFPFCSYPLNIQKSPTALGVK